MDAVTTVNPDAAFAADAAASDDQAAADGAAGSDDAPALADTATPADVAAPADTATPADVAAPADAAAPVDADPGPYPPGMNTSRFGNACPTQGRFGLGDGALLICDAGKWRYALRKDLPARPAGGYTDRPEWYPPLRSIFNLPPDPCHLKLAAAPIAAADVSAIIPNGAMIGDHVTPIDHWYIIGSTSTLPPDQRMAAAYVPVRAAADGTIIEASSLGSPTSLRVVITHACEAVTTYMVINKLTGPLAQYQDTVAAGGFVTPNIAVKAGDTFALQRDTPLDFSVEDGHTWLTGFASPYPYASQDSWKPYTADPLPYWPADIGDAYRAKMQRTSEPRAGRIDWDKVGSAAGNWFVDGTIGYAGSFESTYASATQFVPGGQVAGKHGYSWGHLSLAPHWVDATVWIASIGSWNDPAGDFQQLAIKPGPPAPDALTTANGLVVYELVQWSLVGPNNETVDSLNPPIGYKLKLQDQVAGLLIVRVNADDTITVEKRPDLKKASDFSGTFTKPETYWR